MVCRQTTAEQRTILGNDPNSAAAPSLAYASMCCWAKGINALPGSYSSFAPELLNS